LLGYTRLPAEEAANVDQGGTSLHLRALVFDQVNSAGPATVVTGPAKVIFSVTARVADGTWSYPGAVAMVQAWTASWQCLEQLGALRGLGDEQSTDGGQAPLRRQYGQGRRE
jgi:hypothetical protein